MLVNTTATHTVINASNPKRSCANAPFTNARGAALESSPNCTAASTPATPAVIADARPYQPRGQRRVNAPTSSIINMPPTSAIYGESANHSMVGAVKSVSSSMS